MGLLWVWARGLEMRLFVILICGFWLELEENIREWTGLEFTKFQRALENREKKEETGCEIICAAPTTLAVKG